MLTPSATGVQRVLRRLDELYEIGGGPGANRPGGSAAEEDACELAAGWMRAAGLLVERDGYGNVVGRRTGTRPELPELWTGSHLDSVPQGGRFDGALGVVAGIEALERLGRRERTVAVVVFRSEEIGCLGSRACVASGALPGIHVELHVEQGPVLEAAGAPVGVVSGIVGYARREAVFAGRAGHAGTSPMSDRDDALVKAAEYVLRVRDVARSVAGAVATVGTLDVEPGGVNVIPGAVRLTVDARARDDAALALVLSRLGLPLEPRTAPVVLSDRVRTALRKEVEGRGLPVVALHSGAGHDAGVLAAAGVEAGMLFVRSLNAGASHTPDELSSDEDVALGTDVLASTLARLSAP